MLIIRPTRLFDVKAPAAPGALWRYRLAVASRACAAAFGGYGLASASAAFMAVWLPLARPDAVSLAMILSFVVYACAVIWVFATRNAWRAWGGVLIPTLVLVGGYALKNGGMAE